MMNSGNDWLQALAALALPEERAGAARTLAALLGADDLILFAHDPVTGRSLPAEGFLRTLPGGRAWRDLIEMAVRDGEAMATLDLPHEEGVRARALGTADGSALVLLHVSDERADLAATRTVLPLLGALARRESAQLRAETQERLARQSATEAAELTAKLDATRSELQRAVTAAEHAAHARDEFLATVSHELRTPLTSMIGWLQLVEGETNPEVLREAHQTIERNARAQSRLIEDILDFSRIHAGKLRLDVDAVDLVSVIGAAIDIVRPAAAARGVRLESILDSNAGLVSGDADRLQQVIWNLLSNAVKFTPRDGRVQIHLQRVNSHAEIAVSDTGEGISADFLPFVFDRFSQAETGSTRQYGGLGLGLGIVRQLVELHGGTVRAYSAGRGQGASFVIALPRLIAREQSASEGRPIESDAGPAFSLPEAVSEPQLSGIRILVVEDNDDARALITTILKRSAAQVYAASGVPEALEHLRQQQPDIIISDIEMPGEDGYSFIRKVRANSALARHLPAIALTAYARSVDRVRALASGYQMHMAKPVEPAELIAAVRSLVSATRVE
ncbi:MAG: ATP-binding protein [Acidobacteriota bacterium]